jgi:hypothetical protein
MTVLKAVYEWLNQVLPNGPEWRNPKFPLFETVPFEVRFIICSDQLEFEIGNGGRPQFLWNTFFHWQKILKDCEVGYPLIGAPNQAAAIPKLRKFLEERCEEYIELIQKDKDFRHFS